MLFSNMDLAKQCRQQFGPFAMACLVGDLIVADLDHGAWQAARTGMAFKREIDAVRRGIGLIVADGKAGHRLQPRNQRGSEARIIVMDDADLPWPRRTLVDR